MKHTGFSQPHPAETDLNRLRLWAGIFLELEVLPTRMSPIVVKHPFTDCGIVGLREESGLFRPVNIIWGRPSPMARSAERAGPPGENA